MENDFNSAFFDGRNIPLLNQRPSMYHIIVKASGKNSKGLLSDIMKNVFHKEQSGHASREITSRSYTREVAETKKSSIEEIAGSYSNKMELIMQEEVRNVVKES